MSNYSFSYQNCSSDTFLNTCKTGCCSAFKGGLSPTMTLCAPTSGGINFCSSSTAAYSNITMVSATCAKDSFNNICHDNCCLVTYTLYGLTNTTICSPKSVCDGYNPSRTYGRDNIVEYGKAVGVSL